MMTMVNCVHMHKITIYIKCTYTADAAIAGIVIALVLLVIIIIAVVVLGTLYVIRKRYYSKHVVDATDHNNTLMCISHRKRTMAAEEPDSIVKMPHEEVVGGHMTFKSKTLQILAKCYSIKCSVNIHYNDVH